jgi:hypothetical protein
MKKSTFILFLFVTMLAVVSCPDDLDGPDGSDGPNIDDEANTVITRKFWAKNMVTDAFEQINADRLASNSRCEVWVEKGSGVTAATATTVARAYRDNVYVKMMNTFGYTVNVKIGSSVKNMNTMELAHYLATEKTSGAKFTILLLDIKDGYKTKDDPYVAGYFYAVDLFENDPEYPDIKSNELDMIYLDTYPSKPGSQDSMETLAHEMQHLMNFVSSVLFRSENQLNVMDTWINEGLSGAAEWVYSGEHPEVRWKYYNLDRSDLIKKGNNFYMWDNHKENLYANLDDYATVYLFFQYLRLQARYPNDIYYDISTSKSSDYKAVTTSASINTSHKNDWPLLLRDWHAANYTNATSGLYGYKNDPTLKAVKAPMFPGGTSTVNLFPGEGVYSRTTTTETVPSVSGNIKYAGLSTGTPIDSGSYANGARLTYNINTNKEGTAETGNTTGIAPSVSFSVPGNGSVQIAPNKFSGPFKVDMSYFNRGNADSGVSDSVIRNVFSRNSSSSNSRSAAKSDITVKFDLSTLERVHIDE